MSETLILEEGLPTDTQTCMPVNITTGFGEQSWLGIRNSEHFGLRTPSFIAIVHLTSLSDFFPTHLPISPRSDVGAAPANFSLTNK